MKGRIGKTNRVPKTRANGTWTEAAWWGFLRSGLRQMSRRWPPIARYLQRHRRPYKGPNKRQKFEYQCMACGSWKAGKEVAVDHIAPCGRLAAMSDIEGFVSRLFVEETGLRIICEECHEQRHKIGLGETA